MSDIPWATEEELHDAIDALYLGDKRQMKRIYRRAFWWGFTHPFDRINRTHEALTATVRERRCSCTPKVSHTIGCPVVTGPNDCEYCGCTRDARGDCPWCDPQDLCHCGDQLAYGFDGDPTHHRGMCAHCDAIRCDAYPGECGR